MSERVKPVGTHRGEWDGQLIGEYVRDKARDPNTYVVALVVGTLINAYGHLLVPYLRGEESVTGAFLDHLQAGPVTAILSIVLAYCFPVCVGLYSAVRTRYLNRRFESRALFPDMKPDPVFRAVPDGRIVECGETTCGFLRQHGMSRAQEVLGDEVWARIVSYTERGERLPIETRIHVEATDLWYVVGHSAAPNHAINVYLTQASAPH